MRAVLDQLEVVLRADRSEPVEVRERVVEVDGDHGFRASA